MWLVTLFLLSSFCYSAQSIITKNDNEEDAKEFLARFDEDYGILLNKVTIASWNYETNITEENSQISQDAALKVIKYYNSQLCI